MTEPALVARLAGYSTPTILNGLKRLGMRPDELEVMDRHTIRCMAPNLGPRVGFAVTRKVATSKHPPAPRPAPLGQEAVLADMLGQPAPRVLVVENVGEFLGPVCIWGDLGANINRALGCDTGVTNGPVRDLPEMEAVGFQTFAGGPGAGGGYVDTIEVGGPVTVAGVTVRPGDVIHGDQHGVVKVPLSLVADLPSAIEAHEAHERRIIELCRSSEFSVEALARLMRSG